MNSRVVMEETTITEHEREARSSQAPVGLTQGMEIDLGILWAGPEKKLNYFGLKVS